MNLKTQSILARVAGKTALNFATLGVMTLGVAVSVSADELCPLGGPYVANTYPGPMTSFQPNWPSVTANPDGTFFVVMTAELLDPLNTDITLRAFGSDGVALAPETTVNNPTGHPHTRPATARRSDGSFEVVWQEEAPGGGNILGRRFDASGMALGPVYAINTYTTGEQIYPAVAAHDDGSFDVVWHSDAGQDGSGNGVFGQRFDVTGTADGAEFLVNSITAEDQRFPDIAAFDDGSFVVSWASDDSGNEDIKVQLFDPFGIASGTEFVANTYTTGSQRFSSIGTHSDGSFVLAWNGPNELQPFGQPGFVARRFDSSGTALGASLAVHEGSGVPAVAMHDDGSFVATGVTSGVFATSFDASDVQVQPIQLASGINVYINEHSDVSSHGDGNFVVAFSHQATELIDGVGVSTSNDVYLRRYGLVADCAAAPAEGCLAMSKAKLSYTEKSPNDAKLKLDWRLKERTENPTLFGDPVGGDTSYSIRIYDDAKTLVQELVLDRSGLGCPCWRSKKGKGYRYVDKTSSMMGISKADITTGLASKTKIGIRGRNRGSKGELSLPTGIASALAGSTTPTVQVVASDGACFSATMNRVAADSGDRYSAKLK